MTVASVQRAYKATTSAASVIVPISSSLTTGNTLIGTFLITTAASVTSVTDNLNNRWIRAGISTDTSAGTSEIWYARGVAGGAASVTVTYSGSITAANGISEFSGVYYADPLDQWSQNYGTSASPIGTVTPRTTGDLFIGAIRTASSVSALPSGYSSLFSSGVAGVSAQYYISSGSVASSPTWRTSAASPWVSTVACFRAGAKGLNPQLQIPETRVEISTTSDYLAPLYGIGTWTNISSYVRSANCGPLGRQHELQRAESASGTFQVDGRDGTFNSWNTSSFLYAKGYGLKPMNPVRMIAAWNGVTYPRYYGYLQTIQPHIADPLNVDVTLQCSDIFRMFALKTLSDMTYENILLASPYIEALYDFGDDIGSYSVRDRSDNNRTGTLISGSAGAPTYGASGPFLFDTTTCVDLTNGAASPIGSQCGGISTTNYLTQPPTADQLTSSLNLNWSFECWFRWTGDNPSAATVPNGVLLHFETGSDTCEVQIGVKTGDNGTQGNRFIFATSSNGNPSTMSAPIVPCDGNWHHIAINFSGRSDISWYNTGTFYFDGVAVGGWQFYSATRLTVQPTNITIGSPPQGVNGLDPTGGTTYATACPAELSYAAFYSTTLSASDASTRYALGTWFRYVEFGAVQGNEDAGRLNKVLALLGMDPTTMLVVPLPFRTLLFGETNSIGTVAGLNYIQTLADSEPGLIFQGPDGLIYAYNRQYQYLTSTSNTSQAVFSDAAASTNYRYDGRLLSINQDDLNIWNDIQVQSAREGAAMQEWDATNSSVAAASRTAYGPRTLQGHTSLKMESDTDALSIAQNYAAWYNMPIQRVESLDVHSYSNGGANIPQMLQRGLLDRITVTYNGQQGGSAFSQESVIESITDQIDFAGPTWTTTWALSPYEILLTPIILDTYKFGAAQGTSGFGQFTL